MAADVAVTKVFHGVTNSVADDVDTDFTEIVTWLNTNAVHLDGSKAFTAVPSGPATDATSDNQFPCKSQVDTAFAKHYCRLERLITVQPIAWVVAGGDYVGWETDVVDTDSFHGVSFDEIVTIGATMAGVYAIAFHAIQASVHACEIIFFNQDLKTLGSFVFDASSVDKFAGFNVYLEANSTFFVYVKQTAQPSHDYTFTMSATRVSA